MRPHAWIWASRVTDLSLCIVRNTKQTSAVHDTVLVQMDRKSVCLLLTHAKYGRNRSTRRRMPGYSIVVHLRVLAECKARETTTVGCWNEIAWKHDFRRGCCASASHTNKQTNKHLKSEGILKLSLMSPR
jgi:hypothetical protein